MPKRTKKELKEFHLEAREELRLWLEKFTGGCAVQAGYINEEKADFGWTCGTCFMALLNGLGLDDTKEEYQEHSEPVERHNEVWRAILQIRDSKI